jgi:hypothetical protein
MRPAAFALVTAFLMTSCSSDRDELKRALDRSSSWAATVEAVTDPDVVNGLPRQYVARSCQAASEAFQKTASQIDALSEIDAKAKAAATARVASLAAWTPILAGQAVDGRIEPTTRAAFVNAHRELEWLRQREGR